MHAPRNYVPHVLPSKPLPDKSSPRELESFLDGEWAKPSKIKEPPWRMQTSSRQARGKVEADAGYLPCSKAGRILHYYLLVMGDPAASGLGRTGTVPPIPNAVLQLASSFQSIQSHCSFSLVVVGDLEISLAARLPKFCGSAVPRR